MESAVDRREAGGERATGGLGTSNAPIEISDESESGSSLMGTDDEAASDHNQAICRWRTDRYHDQECERYFDCPSHVVERTPSEHDDSEDEIPDSEEEPNDSDVEMEDVGESPSRFARPSQRQARQDGRDPHTPDPAASSSSSSRGEPAWEREGSRFGSRTHFGTQENPIVLDSPERSRIHAGPSPSPPDEVVAESSRAAALRAPERAPVAAFQPPSEVPSRSASFATPSAPPSYNQSFPSDVQGSGERNPGEIVLPRWQPDAEVTYCPICNTQFSIFVRKHHCRKCGRVVCNACSPHRITIPYQYIVQPHGAPRAPAPRYNSPLVPPDVGSDHFGSLGGGESVRLCNPCVPDPNTTPPQAQDSQLQLAQPRAHGRSHSSLGRPYMPEASSVISRFASYSGNASGLFDPFARSRSSTMATGGPSSSRQPNPYLAGPFQNRPYPAGHPGYYPPASTGTSPRPRVTSSSTSRFAGLVNPAQPSSSTGGLSSSMNRRLPPTPSQQQQYQIAEEDECPVCHRELPSRSLSNWEAARESHITTCITSHSAYGGSGAGSPGVGGASPGSPMSPRRTGMFPYTATEKDCVDSAECSICLEEFEVGVKMARLECLCRFHKHCIDAWWQRHPGRCPMHQHDSFGY